MSWADGTTEITSYEDVIDSREVIARIEYLTDQAAEDEGLDEAESHELRVLLELAEACDAADWQYGETLIRDSYFKEYAQEFAEDCGMIPEGLNWPVSCIDWDQAARELRMDYSCVEFDGVTYWYR